MSSKIREYVRRSPVYFANYILDEANIILEEQRKMNVQISLRKACKIIRGRTIEKKVLLDFMNAINNINFNETAKTKKFKQEIYEAYIVYNDYYTDDGIRKLENTQN